MTAAEIQLLDQAIKDVIAEERVIKLLQGIRQQQPMTFVKSLVTWTDQIRETDAARAEFLLHSWDLTEREMFLAAVCRYHDGRLTVAELQRDHPSATNDARLLLGTMDLAEVWSESERPSVDSRRPKRRSGRPVGTVSSYTRRVLDLAAQGKTPEEIDAAINSKQRNFRTRNSDLGKVRRTLRNHRKKLARTQNTK